MTLKSLQIELMAYGSDKGRYVGKIKFEGDSGEVHIKLNPDDCQRMFAIVADGITATAREVAERLTAECMKASPPPALKIG